MSEDMHELIMLISDLRAKDQEKFETHIKLMNEVVNAIREISTNIKSESDAIQSELGVLQDTITESLNSLLASINPSGVRETTKALDRIMTTMNKSIQGMNLDQAMQQIRILTGGISTQLLNPSEIPQGEAPGERGPEDLKAPGASGVSAEQGEEMFGYVPDSYKKKQQQKQKKQDKLLKPSDLFG